MKTIKYLSLILLGVFVLAVSCKDDKELVPVWESGVHGLGAITSTAQDFKRGEPTIGLDFDLAWISVDSKTTVTKIDVFALFKEEYTDTDGNPAVADHGGESGRLYTSFEGGSVPGNRESVTFSLSQPELFALYQDITYDYKDGNGVVSVFNNPINPGRDATNRFVAEDKFTIRWEFTTSDGRVFGKYGNGWSPSVCSEFPGANCILEFGVICAEEITAPAGDWKFDMVDTYGDGWQGGYIGVVVDGTETDQVFLYSQYDPGGVPLSSGSQTVTVPGTATTLKFVWHDDNYNVECQFKITSPKGNVVANVTNVSAGDIKLNLCKE